MSTENQNTQELSDISLASLITGFLVPGALQGLAFYFLTEYSDSESNILTNTLRLFVVITPFIYFLLSTLEHRVSSLVSAIVISSICCALYASMQHQYMPESLSLSGMDNSWPHVISIGGTIITLAIGIPFYRALIHRNVRATHYPTLFEFAWNQVVVVAFALFLVLLVFGVLWVATLLFETVELNVKDLIWQSKVIFPVCGASFALGIGITGAQGKIIHTMGSLIIGLMRVILPLHLLLITVFLGAIAVYGFGSMGADREINIKLLFAIAVSLTLCTSAVGNGEFTVSRWMEGLWRVLSVPTLLLSVIAMWMIWQRVSGYGPTHLHIISSLFVFFGFIHAVGYFVSALLSKHGHTGLQQTNIFAAMMIIIITLLIQTPLFDPVVFSTSYQKGKIMLDGNPVDTSKLVWLHRFGGTHGQLVLDDIYSDESLELPPRSALRSRTLVKNIGAPTSVKEKLAKVYQTNRLRILSHDVELDDARISSLEEALAELSVITRDCAFSEWMVCRVIVTNSLVQDTELALIAIKNSESSMSLSWLQRSNRGNWIPFSQSRRLSSLRKTLYFTPAEVDDFMAQIESGQLPIRTYSINAVAIGNHAFVPTAEESLTSAD